MLTDKYPQMIADRKWDGLYSDLTYQIIGSLYEVHNELGSVHKESVYMKAVSLAFKNKKIKFVQEKSLPVFFQRQKVGTYRPDFVIEDKVILELKAVSNLTQEMLDQIYYYVKATPYKLVLLANFGSNRLMIKRRIFS